jgi:hypothetical protein
MVNTCNECYCFVCNRCDIYDGSLCESCSNKVDVVQIVGSAYNGDRNMEIY